MSVTLPGESATTWIGLAVNKGVGLGKLSLLSSHAVVGGCVGRDSEWDGRGVCVDA